MRARPRAGRVHDRRTHARERRRPSPEASTTGRADQASRRSASSSTSSCRAEALRPRQLIIKNELQVLHQLSREHLAPKGSSAAPAGCAAHRARACGHQRHRPRLYLMREPVKGFLTRNFGSNAKNGSHLGSKTSASSRPTRLSKLDDEGKNGRNERSWRLPRRSGRQGRSLRRQPRADGGHRSAGHVNRRRNGDRAWDEAQPTAATTHASTRCRPPADDSCLFRTAPTGRWDLGTDTVHGPESDSVIPPQRMMWCRRSPRRRPRSPGSKRARRAKGAARSHRSRGADPLLRRSISGAWPRISRVSTRATDGRALVRRGP